MTVTTRKTVEMLVLARDSLHTTVDSHASWDGVFVKVFATKSTQCKANAILHSSLQKKYCKLSRTTLLIRSTYFEDLQRCANISIEVSISFVGKNMK